MPIPSYNEIMELLKKGVTFEAQEKIMALREGAMSLQEENLKLRAELQGLKQETDIEKLMRFDGRIYEIHEGDKKGVYCPTCYDKDKNLIRLQRTRPNTVLSQNGFIYQCKVCHFHA